MAVILLVLGAVHLRVVGGDQNQPSPQTGVRKGKERVSGHVHAHVLHDRKGPGPSERRPHGRFQGDFFVGGPLHMRDWSKFPDFPGSPCWESRGKPRPL